MEYDQKLKLRGEFKVLRRHGCEQWLDGFQETEAAGYREIVW